MPKFKIGDTVKCLPVAPTFIEGGDVGAGFVPGKQFKVWDITNADSKNPIYWPKNCSGVYEHELESCDWDE